MQGVVVNTNREFFHCKVDDQRVFVHETECDFVVGDLLVGDIVEIYSLEASPKGDGLRGRQVSFVERPAHLNLSTVEAVVVYVDAGKLIGFARPETSTVFGTNRSSDDVFFHVTSFPDHSRVEVSPTFLGLSRGDRIRGVIRDTSRGKRMEAIAVV